MKRIIITSILALLSSAAMAQNCQSDMDMTAPNARFAKYDSGIVKDLKTGLTWMRCPIGKTWDKASGRCQGSSSGMLWPSALNEVQAINSSSGHALHQFAGIQSWRLPNIKELVSLKEAACHYPAINDQAFAGAFDSYLGNVQASFWSSTPAGTGSDVFVFDAADGLVINQGPTFSQGQYAVLLVADQ
ncbi:MULTISPECIES: DUF1566 domain-containing protein [Ferrimonas]|uniref:Lcl C-terminal domain-containing protein n=1 Tax=Ferrimonas TaxID=44011 RepID=UPI00041A2CDD|nr:MULTISPECIES: DUF1566 domain-containing protein [Ferrimonas]USD35880.1 DUF1566 domain-containing protein [Ferrimonas sp. SCSIO 43195]